MPIDRDEAIRRIKAGLKRRSGRAWSVTGGKGTAWGWIEINAVPSRRTWHFVTTATPNPPAPGACYRGVSCVTPHYRVCAGAADPILSPDDDPWAREAIENGRYAKYSWEVEDPSREYGHMSPADRIELGKLLGLEHPVHYQGESIAAGSDYREEYVARAEGREPAVTGTPYWD